MRKLQAQDLFRLKYNENVIFCNQLDLLENYSTIISPIANDHFLPYFFGGYVMR